MTSKKQNERKEKLPISAYLAFILALLFLSGILSNVEGPLACWDFTNVLGKFGKMGTTTLEEGVTFANDFKGIGGVGVKEGFLTALHVAPGIILAFGVIELYTAFGGAAAAEKIFGPIMRSLLGIPGSAVTALIANLTSADASAGVARSLHDNNLVTREQNIIITSFLFSGAAIMVNYYMLGTVLFPYIEIPVALPLGIIIVMKFVGSLLLRIWFKFRGKKEEA